MKRSTAAANARAPAAAVARHHPGEDLGPYPSQVGSNPGYPASGPTGALHVCTTDALQPVLAAAPDGRVSLAFDDRRLPCPAQGSAEATRAALSKDNVNPAWTGSLPPYGAANYCLNMSVQFYDANLTPRGRNVRVSSNSCAMSRPAAPHRHGAFGSLGVLAALLCVRRRVRSSAAATGQS